jgi:hypothetical protein
MMADILYAQPQLVAESYKMIYVIAGSGLHSVCTTALLQFPDPQLHTWISCGSIYKSRRTILPPLNTPAGDKTSANNGSCNARPLRRRWPFEQRSRTRHRDDEDTHWKEAKLGTQCLALGDAEGFTPSSAFDNGCPLDQRVPHLRPVSSSRSLCSQSKSCAGRL